MLEKLPAFVGQALAHRRAGVAGLAIADPARQRGDGRLALSSPNFGERTMMPAACTADGEGRSPALTIAGVPEGTRSPTDAMGRFHAGAFALAAETGVPVLPYCLHGTGDMLPRGAFFLRPANIRARVLPPMSAPQGPDGPDARALRKTVKAAMTRALDEMKHD